MADTPKNMPVKRIKKPAEAKPAKVRAVRASTVSSRTGDAPALASEPVSAVPVRKIRAAKATASGTVGTGWTAQAAPLKAKAEKAAKTAADTLNAVDWKAHIDPIKDQAGKTAKSAANVAKDKTGTAMQSLSKLIAEGAGTVDSKLGPQYGDYARQAANQVAEAANALDSKDVDQLVTEARDFVRKSPAVAIGAAAVVGFVLMRLMKGSDEA